MAPSSSSNQLYRHVQLCCFRALLLVLSSCALFASADNVLFKEEFSDGDKWQKRWVQSEASGKEFGEFKLSAGKFYGDAEKDKGIQTSQDARFYGLSAKFPKKFTNANKPLVIQFQVKHEQNIDCGGGYVKVYPSDLDQKGMHGESPYNIMFGPDICGPGTKKVHVIFQYKGKNLQCKKDIRCKDDEYTHLYTLVVNPDNKYVVKIDNKEVQSGSLDEDWEFLAPKTIKDPDAKKPGDWDDNENIADPEDKKPEEWDKPEFSPDPAATKPADWDEEMDGEWEPPMISNPDFKGEWKARDIPNPAYKGKWIHPEIANPEYSEDADLYKYEDFGAIGFDLWQVKSGTIFDNILLTDDEEFARKYADDTWGETAKGEKAMKEKQDEEERKKQEEEDKKRAAEEPAGKSDDDKDDMEDMGEGEDDDEGAVHDHHHGADEHEEL